MGEEVASLRQFDYQGPIKSSNLTSKEEKEKK